MVPVAPANVLRHVAPDAAPRLRLGWRSGTLGRVNDGRKTGEKVCRGQRGNRKAGTMNENVPSPQPTPPPTKRKRMDLPPVKKRELHSSFLKVLRLMSEPPSTTTPSTGDAKPTGSPITHKFVTVISLKNISHPKKPPKAKENNPIRYFLREDLMFSISSLNLFISSSGNIFFFGGMLSSNAPSNAHQTT
jgi:hypothetical protein